MSSLPVCPCVLCLDCPTTTIDPAIYGFAFGNDIGLKGINSRASEALAWLE